MSRVEVTQASAPLSDGILQTDLPIDGTPQVVKDQLGNSSTLLLANDETQINSTLRVHTDSAELLDLEDTGNNNRFNINRDVQKINLDFASKPSDITTQVGAIRTAQDGTNLADAVKFQENGQVTFTERVKIESDSTVSTQTSAVIEAITTNSSIVLKPQGTGAIIASVPDGTLTGGNARGAVAIDFQMGRDSANQVASGEQSIIVGGRANRANGFRAAIVGGEYGTASGSWSFIGGGNANTASASYCGVSNGSGNNVSSNYSTISGGQSNTASTNTHATVPGGLQNSATGLYSFSGGSNSVASAARSFAYGESAKAYGNSSVAIGGTSVTASAQGSIALGGVGCNAYSQYSFVQGYFTSTYLLGQLSFSGGSFNTNLAQCQQSLLTSLKEASLTSAATSSLSLDGTGTTNLIIPNGNNRAWNVQIDTIAVVTAITGTATGVNVGDCYRETKQLLFKRIGGTSSIVGTVDTTSIKSDTSMSTAALTVTAGASQQMALTFTAPTFAGSGSVTCRIVSKVSLVECAY